MDLTPKNSVLTLRRYLSGASNAQTRADSAAVDAVWSCRTRFTHWGVGVTRHTPNGTLS